MTLQLEIEFWHRAEDVPYLSVFILPDYVFYCLKEGILVCMGCYNKIPQSGWPKQQLFISHTS